MEHILQFGINIDDNAIIKCVSQKAETVIFDEIKTDIKNAVYKTSYYGKTLSEVQNWVVEEFNKFLEEHKDEIIVLASEKLADKLSRTKAVKERVVLESLNKVLEDID